MRKKGLRLVAVTLMLSLLTASAASAAGFDAGEEMPSLDAPTEEFALSASGQSLTGGEMINEALKKLSLLNFSEEKPRVTTVDLHLPTSVSSGDSSVSISWQSSDTSWLTNDGVIMQRPDNGSHRVTLTATLSAKGEEVTKQFVVAIKASEEVKAFPGAQGYGTQTRGGAYGYVCHVTTLAPEGPGSLKEAVETKKGARTIVFDVGGTIDLTSVGRALVLKGDGGSNVTIAGQTAPGEGIQLKGYGLNLSNVHDVIVRNISIRIGNVRKAGDTYQSDPMSVSGANQRVVLDHISMCWAVDMGFRVYGQEITMSNCMISKGLYWNTPHEKGKHNYAGMFGPKYGTFYGNYIADCGQRAPRIIDNEFIDVRNNVVANSKYTFDICNYEWMGANPKFNIVNNAVLMGNPAPGGSTSNVTTAGSYKYFQGRTYSGGLFTYSANNYDNTQGARAIDASAANLEGALWTGKLEGSDKVKNVGEEMGSFSAGGYSNIADPWKDMIYPSDISLSDYNSSLVSKQGNTLMPYPFAAPSVKTYSAREAAKYVLSNAGSRSRIGGDILTRRYLAEGRTRLQILSDYLKGAKVYGIELPSDYAGETAYGLPVHTQTAYLDSNGMTVYAIDGKVDGLTVSPSDYQDNPEVIKYVTTADEAGGTHLDSLYAVGVDTEGNLNGNKYLLKLSGYGENDDIYDAFDLYDAAGDKLNKPSNYATTASGTTGMAWKGIYLKWCDWGDGAGNYNHQASSVTDGNIGTDIADTEWSVYDWPQLPTVYRDGKWDSNGDGIPDFYAELMGWTGYGDKDISREDFEGRGYTNLEYYINDCCAGDMEPEDSVDDDPAPAENVRDGSGKFDTHTTHEILFNTVKRAKAKLYYCEGSEFNAGSAKEIDLNKYYEYDVNDIGYTLDSDDKPIQSKYRTASDFDTYFSYVLSDLKPATTYSYKIETYSDTGIRTMTDDTYHFTTKAESTGKPATPRISKYVPFDQRITINFEPGSEDKYYNQTTYTTKSGKSYYLTYLGNNDYDTKTDHFILRYSTSSDMSGAKSVTIPSTATSYVLTGLENGREYYLDFRSVSADGTESDCAKYNQKQISDTGSLDKDGNKVYAVQGIQASGRKVAEYYPDYDVAMNTVAIEPSKYTINVDYAKELEENEIGEGETTKFITVFGDVLDWYIYTLGGIPIPTTPEDGDKPILMLRDDNHDHGFTYAKKFDTPLDGKATIRCKLMIKGEELDPMNQAPELRFYLQQDSADSDNAEGDEGEATADTGTAKEATTFGTTISLSFTKNDINYNGDAISRYTTDTWYDIKLLLNADEGTCDLYLNDKLIRAGLEYSDSATSNTIARWQISSRLAGKEDVYVQYMYAYTGWEEPVTDPDATPAPDTSVKEGTSGSRGGGGGGGGGGGSSTTVKSTPTHEPTATADPTATAEPSSTDAPDESPAPSEKPSDGGDRTTGFTDMQGYEWAEEAVNNLCGQGIVSGVSDTEFAPARNITRAEFAAILMRAIGADTENARCSFEDVPEDAWFYGAVAAAYEMGVVSGFSDTYFGASENITRQDMAAMLMRLTAKADITLVRKRDYAEFTDENSISDYAKNSVHILYQCEIINGMGDGSFAPLENTTRAAAARVVYGVFGDRSDNNGEE